jgi:DNA repair ATPase RecN
MDEIRLQDDITNIKIQLEKMSTLLAERREMIKENAANIGLAAKDIAKVKTDLHLNDEETHKIAERQNMLEARLEKRLDNLELKLDKFHDELKALHETQSQVKTLWKIFLLVAAAIVGAIVKLFMDE